MSWPLLQSGDPVSIIAPAGPFEPAIFEQGVAALKELGLEPRFDPRISERIRYLAGDEQRRLSELLGAFRDPQTRAVFCARGGYGAMHLLPRIPVKELPDKPLVGFSDITALHLLWQRNGRRSIHGPVVTQLGKQPAGVKDALGTLLFQGRAPTLTGAEPIVAGTATAPVVGGNLSVLTRLIGTPYLPELRGKILLVEDVGERPYRLDRMLTHLQLAGLLDGLAGIAVGGLTGCEEKEADYTAREIVRELLGRLAIPSALGFSVGHGEVNFPVVLGAPARLDAGAGTLTPVEA
ncbi:MAG: LD-carboxypeptidase [Deltaproteobacteria bacterium]|nr:LD-carboxypeptidase [Deltaproteobacteria bacterium]